jgi:alpha-L-arabinofuranosidase
MRGKVNFVGASFMLAILLVASGVFNIRRASAAEPIVITVQTNEPGAKINPAMWGAFFEDINFGADGGLYAELVKNGSFEFPEPLMGWIKIEPSNSKGNVTVISTEPPKPGSDLSHFVRIESKAGTPLGISNVGYRGMGVRAGESYDFSAQIRAVSGKPNVSVELVGTDGTTLASAHLDGINDRFKKITATLKPNDTDSHARLTIIQTGVGAIDVDQVSLFPQNTWKHRPGGLRTDMVQTLADLKPGFLRFPGGCIVEGSDLSKRYQWKNTIGPVEDRKMVINRWNYEFKHRPTPDYFQSFGLGFFEFFQLCDDIGAEPLPILNCGMACQFNSGELCAPDEIQNYIQDALDLIEFANGPADSTWGAKRAAMGHPAPFNMKMLGIGNEQWGPQYIERLKLFTRVLKEKHPEIQLVSASGPSPDDERFHFLWPQLSAMHADIVDQHCYANPIWFLTHSDRFDKYDRNGPKVFFGEYAAQSVAIVSTKNRNNLECALAEAAYMIGMERNADVVRMASYAPLFANIEAWQWTPNLIWTDSLRVVPTTNYYVQQLFAQHRGDSVLPVTSTAAVNELPHDGRIGIGTNHATADFRNVRVEEGESAPIDTGYKANYDGWTGGPSWQTADKMYRQTDAEAVTTSFAGDKTWGDYTVKLQFRKTSDAGNVMFTLRDTPRSVAGANESFQWIVGGWNNKQHGIQTHFAEQDDIIDRVEGSIETNRWYDAKIVLRGSHVECYLDDRLVETANLPRRRVPALFTSAARDDKTGATILKVVNPGDAATEAIIQLKGTDREQTGSAIVLAGNLADENTLDHPNTVVPKTDLIPSTSPRFDYTFRPHSLTVLELRDKPVAR